MWLSRYQKWNHPQPNLPVGSSGGLSARGNFTSKGSAQPLLSAAACRRSKGCTLRAVWKRGDEHLPNRYHARIVAVPLGSSGLPHVRADEPLAKLSTYSESRCASAASRMPTHLQQTDGKGLGRQAAEFLDDRFPLGDARSKPKCRPESCRIARAPSPNCAKVLLGSSEISQAAGALLSD